MPPQDHDSKQVPDQESQPEVCRNRQVRESGRRGLGRYERRIFESETYVKRTKNREFIEIEVPDPDSSPGLILIGEGLNSGGGVVPQRPPT